MKPFAQVLVLCCISSFTLSAQDCLPGWAYRADITVDNPGDEHLSDYQLPISINTGALVSAGKMRADGGDIRLTDGDCNLLSFFVDSVATSNVNTIWVKIPQLAAAENLTIRLYYGNPNATSVASGDDTFVFFDDFSGDEVDLNKWEPIGEYHTLAVIDGQLHYASTAMNPGPRFKFVRTAQVFTDDLLFDFAATVTNSTGFGFSSADSTIHRLLYRSTSSDWDTLNQIAYMSDTVSNGYQLNLVGPYPNITYERFTRYDTRIRAGITEDGHHRTTYFGNETLGSFTQDTFVWEPIQLTGYHFILSSFSQSPTVTLDYLRVRRPAEVPPTYVSGPEMANPDFTATVELAPPGAVQLFPNPAREEVQLLVEIDEALWLEVYDSRGQRLRRTNLSGAFRRQVSLEISDWPAGTYWVQLRRSRDGILVYRQPLIVLP